MPFGIFSLCQVGGSKGKTTQTGAALAVLPVRSILASHGCAPLLRASCPQSFHLPCHFVVQGGVVFFPLLLAFKAVVSFKPGAKSGSLHFPLQLLPLDALTYLSRPVTGPTLLRRGKESFTVARFYSPPRKPHFPASFHSILATRGENLTKFENAHALIPEKRTLFHSFLYTV